jgi:hypothetical protein
MKPTYGRGTERCRWHLDGLKRWPSLLERRRATVEIHLNCRCAREKLVQRVLHALHLWERPRRNLSP